MRDKPQEALHLISGARSSSRPRRGAAAGGGSRFRAIYATEWHELALNRLLVGRARAHRRPAAARPKVCQACPIIPLT